MKLLPFLTLGLSSAALAADHAEAPGTQADPSADIADFYAWHTADGTIVAIITVGPLSLPGTAAVYDADTIYTVNIDTDIDQVADIEINARFGQNGNGDWGLQVEGLPGASGTLAGAVETVLEDGNVKAFAGLRDDPFFFDATGFFDTLGTGTLAFTGGDDFAGTNITAIVLEFDTSATTGSSHAVQLWATTGRK